MRVSVLFSAVLSTTVAAAAPSIISADSAIVSRTDTVTCNVTITPSIPGTAPLSPGYTWWPYSIDQRFASSTPSARVSYTDGLCNLIPSADGTYFGWFTVTPYTSGLTTTQLATIVTSQWLGITFWGDKASWDFNIVTAAC